MTVSAGGVITGLNFIPGAAATMTSPTSVPLHLLALEQAANPGVSGELAVGGDSAGRVTSDAQLRAAIVNVAGYYLRLAKTKTPAQMEALIWGDTSSDGTDHGPSCAAFASLTLELAAQTVGLQSWASGGTTYPWPLHEWADVRVQTNSDSPAITSMQADAQQHGRWHPVGDSYRPQPGDWAIYDGHVEVVTSYANGVLDTIGADSLPNLTVNAHSSAAPLAEQGVQGFIDNGNLPPAAGSLGASAPTSGEQATPSQEATPPTTQRTSPTATSGASSSGASSTGSSGTGNAKARAAAHPSTQRPAAAAGPAKASAAVPGLPGAAALSGSGGIPGTDAAPGHRGHTVADATASIPGLQAASASPATMDAPGTAVIPGASAAEATGAAQGSPSAHPTQPKHAATPATSPANTKPAPASKPSTPASSAPSSSSGSSSGSSSSGSSSHQYATPGTRNQQAFISLVAPGAAAAQQRYGVPASVTIAQAIEESAWGQSGLAAQYHNLFGVKGTGPAGSVSLPTSEYQGGRWVTVDAGFRVYHNDAESIADHAELLATSGYYTRAMGDRAVPDAFANALTGVYATDPNYGANLIALMKLYNLYQYDASPAAAPTPTVSHVPSTPTASQTPTQATTPTTPAATPSASATTQQTATPEASPTASPSSSPASTPTAQPSSGATGHTATGQTGTSGTLPATARSAGQIPGLISPGQVTSGATAPSHVTPAKRPASRQTPANRSSAKPSPTASSGSASIPGAFAPGTGTITSASTGPGPGPAANARVPGVRVAGATQAAARPTSSRPVNVVTAAYVTPARATTEQAAIGHVTPGHGTAQRASTGAAWYEQQLPHPVATALFANAKGPLARGEHLYRDVAACTNVSWKLLAAVDWMQCKADPRYSPVQGEKLGARNDDGTSYSTKSAALTQCACDLLELSGAVYGIDLTARRPLSVRELAAAFAAFRWGAILWRHGVSPMEFPYSVAGLTAQHQKMHWPSIDAPDAPDRPGARFREQFGAVPVVLSLGYPATV